MDQNTHTNRFTYSERLRGRRAVDSLFAEGRSGFVYPFRYVWQACQGEHLAPASVLVSVPKRNHKRAVNRNKLKRRTREAYRLQKAAFVEGVVLKGVKVRLALVYSSKEIEEYNTIRDALRKIMSAVSSAL